MQDFLLDLDIISCTSFCDKMRNTSKAGNSMYEFTLGFEMETFVLHPHLYL